MRTIYIVDDDDAVRASVQGLLSLRSNLIIRAFRSGDLFLAALDDCDPGVVLLDHHMPGTTGLEVLRRIAPLASRFAPIMLTGQGDVQLAVHAMKSGAFEFLEKPCDPHVLLRIVDQSFDRFETESVAAERARTARARIARLSARETDVLRGLIEGHPNKVIAHELSLSPRTVEIYRANLTDKLDVRSLSEALRIAFAAGLVTAD